MFNLFRDFKSLFKIKRINIDYPVFKLHVQFSCGLLCVFVVFLLTANLAGVNIHCDNKNVDQNMLGEFLL